MRPKYLLAILLLFASLCVFGQQRNTIPMQNPQRSNNASTFYQHDLIMQLQAENQKMKMEIEHLKEEVDYYRGDVKAKVSEIDEDHSRWTAWICLFVTLIAGGMGIAVPLFINHRNDKELKEQVKKATEQAEKAEKAHKDLKDQLDNIEFVAKRAEAAAIDAKTSQLFTEALNEKDSYKAIRLYDKAIALNPNFLEAYGNRGILKAKTGDHAGALADYDKVIELKPNDARTYYNRGNLKKQMGNRSGALSDYNTAISLKQDYSEAFNNRGILKSDMVDQVGAMSDYDKAISFKPNNVNAYNNRGNLKNRMGDQIGALSDYSTAISFKPDYAKAYNNRAQCYRKLAESEQDPTKKEELIAKAEADEKKAESLKKSGKA